MIITKDQIVNLLREAKSPELSQAQKHEDRLRLHGDERDTAPIDNPAYDSFVKNYPSALLPPDKANTFKSLLTWPLPTVSIINEIYGELSKVFEGQNKVIEFYFKDEEKEGDFQSYREKIKEPTFWSGDAWDLVRTNINSVIAIDLPEMQGSSAPEPRFFVIPVKSIHAILNDPITNKCEFLIWKSELTVEEKEQKIQDVALAYDDEFYRLLHKKEGATDFEVVKEVAHDLGYAPARMLWTNKHNKSTIQKAAPHSRQLGDTDWILYQTICSRHLELYAGFPIITTYEEECNFQNSDGFECDGGWIQTYSDKTHTNQGDPTIKDKCPSCSSRKLIGAGSVKEVPAPIENTDASLMPAVEITTGDVESLKWFSEDLDLKIAELNQSVTGRGQEPSNLQAKNEKQVQSDFENRQAVLAGIATNLEQIQKFTLDTIALLRYGKGQYKGSVVSYGTKFFLQSEQDVLLNYETAKKQGMPNYILEHRRIAMLQKQFKNDPQMMERVQILDQLEPLPDYSISEISSMKLTNQDTLAYKIHFNDLIKRFELEEDDIVKFGEGMKMDIKIAKIDEKLKKYLKDLVPPPPKEGEERDEFGNPIKKETNVQLK